MSILKIDTLIDIEVLFFTDWDIFHRSLVGIRLPPANLSIPRVVALPGMKAGRPRGRIYGFGRKSDLVELSVPDQIMPIRQ